MVFNVNECIHRFVIISGIINSICMSTLGQLNEYDTYDYYDPSDQLAMEIEVQPYNGTVKAFAFIFDK